MKDGELFNKATLAGAKKCAPCQYATAEAYLALLDHYEKIGHGCSPYLDKQVNSINIVKEKSLEALKLTPCEKPAPPHQRHLHHPHQRHLHHLHHRTTCTGTGTTTTETSTGV